MRAASWTWRPISPTDYDISLVAEATLWTLADACSDAAATVPDRCCVFSAVCVRVPAAASSSVDADEKTSAKSSPPNTTPKDDQKPHNG